MFAATLKEHKARQAQSRAHVAECRAAVLRDAEAFSAGVLDEHNGPLLEALSNQKRLEADTRQLQLQTAQFTKQMERWTASFGAVNDALKEFGDLSNWAMALERDMTAIAQSLAAVVAHKQQQQQQQQRQAEERRRSSGQPQGPSAVTAAEPAVASESAATAPVDRAG